MSIKIFDFLRFIVLTCLTVGMANADVRMINADASGVRSVANTRAGSARLERGTPVSGTDKGVKNTSRFAITARSTNVNNVARSAINTQKVNNVRSAVVSKGTTVSGRSAATPINVGRATAIFSDVSKIGSGYAECRDAYATCMDQFCAVMNDKYRRCYCSEKLSEFQNIEDALDQAVSLLAKFEDNNLNAVDKTAAEVNAMYSATAGEAAIKNDTSGAALMLDEISDLLAGRKSKNNTNTVTSLTGTNIDFSMDIDDIWSDNTSSNNIFATSDAKDLSTLSGVDLYNNAMMQCVSMISDSCQNDAVMNMAKSSYSIMITQDCNAYSKNIDSKREQVKQTVRTAEKYLREARLDEYRSHNSADMNECISKVKTAIQQDLACGENYNRCLDNTGVYINATTGEAIYSQRLFQLTDLITLDGQSTDVLSQNANFDKFLDSKRKFVETALDTCRDIADDVWTEFKRTALIEIAQAQDEKIESVKMSCVQTMTECYDTQSDGLKDMDKSTSKAASAMGVVAAREMCADKVIACASLYGDTKGCSFDGNGKLIAGNNNNGTRCGLTSLLNFVDTVDTARMSEACDTIVENYLQSLCTPTSGTYGYPYNCSAYPLGTPDDGSDAKTLYGMVKRQIENNCISGLSDKDDGLKNVEADVIEKARLAMNNLVTDMSTILGGVCESEGGLWGTIDSDGATNTTSTASQPKLATLNKFYQTVYGGREITYWGVCAENTPKVQCELQNAATGDKGYATFNETTGMCSFTAEWYEIRCNMVGGYWGNGLCYLKK